MIIMVPFCLEHQWLYGEVHMVAVFHHREANQKLIEAIFWHTLLLLLQLISLFSTHTASIGLVPVEIGKMLSNQ